MSDNSYALYIHIPFCERKCNYCDFTSYEGRSHLMGPYLSVLKKEIEAYSGALEGPALKSIYFGGGTPSLLNEADVRDILSLVNENYAVSGDAEISMEVNPGTVNLSKLMGLKSAGINRLSIGVQSFSDDQLKRLGRIHTANQASYTISSARSAGFDNINIDLIFALPRQDRSDWQNSLKTALSLKPEHISTYNLVVEKGTPFFESLNRSELPADDEECLMYEDAISTLTKAGYGHYEISNFAKPGFECANNVTYWKNREYIGVGAGATSYIARSRYSNPRGIEDYVAEWSDPAPSILNDKRSIGLLGPEQEFQETMFLGLRLTKGVDLSEIDRRFGRALTKKYQPAINELVRDEMLDLEGTRLRLSKKGLFLANEVFEKFV